MEVSLIRFLYGRPLDTLLATWGVGMILQQVVLLRFGANLQTMHLPEACKAGWAVGGLTIPVYRVFIVGVTLLCLLAVYLWFYKTSFGLKIRAVVQNRPMASALGINTRWVDSLTFAFASGLAGVAGCILAHLYTVKYNMGADYIVEAFMVVILGGVGQLHRDRRRRGADRHGRQRRRKTAGQRLAGQGGRAAGGDRVHPIPPLRTLRHQGAEL